MMMKPPAAVVVDFPDEALKEIVAAVPPGAPPERLKLLPAILRAWAQEDLREHLSRESRTVFRGREEQLQAIKEQTKDLLNAFKALDEVGFSELALRPQIHRESTELWNVDVEIADCRRDKAISWLNDLVEALEEPQPEPEPDTRTRHYLVIRDMAAIFELVTREPATRRTNSDTNKQYGPFWNFTTALWSAVYGSKHGQENALTIWATEVSRQSKRIQGELARAEEGLGRQLDPKRDKAIVERIVSRYRSSSPFVANLQFRHRSLWRKLRATMQ
jgi:hypothetical protein